MNSFSDPLKRRKEIMSRYKNPKFKGELKTNFIESYSVQCLDNLKLYLKWEKEILIEAKHISEGCAVFISSTDLFIEQMIGKTKVQIKELIENYEKMIDKKNYNENIVGSLTIFDNVKTHLNRVLCANMISELLKKHL
ncbi:MAG: iron-sulfur cluster assembly scaffold protein [Mycoplasma sp.]|nr:iron-sulfur cluster assembly scaffold protein [Mycoplasma sp.]